MVTGQPTPVERTKAGNNVLHVTTRSDFQTPTAMISPKIVLPKDCNETTVTIVCHDYHSQCGFNSHPAHPPVLLQQLHTLSPFTASPSQSAESALLGEHPPSKPRQEGSSRGSHMGQVRQADLTRTLTDWNIYVDWNMGADY